MRQARIFKIFPGSHSSTNLERESSTETRSISPKDVNDVRKSLTQRRVVDKLYLWCSCFVLTRRELWLSNNLVKARCLDRISSSRLKMNIRGLKWNGTTFKCRSVEDGILLLDRTLWRLFTAVVCEDHCLWALLQGWFFQKPSENNCYGMQLVSQCSKINRWDGWSLMKKLEPLFLCSYEMKKRTKREEVKIVCEKPRRSKPFRSWDHCVVPRIVEGSYVSTEPVNGCSKPDEYER